MRVTDDQPSASNADWQKLLTSQLLIFRSTSQSGVQMKTRPISLQRLREAFAQGQLTLYLGAGASVASGIPSWDRLVTQLYVNGIARRLGRFLSVPALIPSVGKWAFAQQVVPLEVAARKLRGYYRDDSDLLLLTQAMLYGLTGYVGRNRLRPAEIRRFLAGNTTLRAVSRLCRETLPGKRGVKAVITYNYDDFLEKSLGRCPYQSIWGPIPVKRRKLPIFHVHGYIPAGSEHGSRLDEIVLTEDQYNRAAQDPYSWQNLVQIHALSASVGLMVGLSLTDRNLRRILDALKNLPQRVENYALLRYPGAWKIDDKDVENIFADMKQRIRDGFEFGYGPNPMPLIEKPGIRRKILDTVRALEEQDLAREEATLAELGVRIIWYREHAEIEDVINKILPPSGRTN